MNPLARPLVPAVAGLLLAATSTEAALTNEPPPVVSQPLATDPARPRPAPIARLDRQSKNTQPLKPGVYQTRPCAILLVVPGPEPDDRSVVGGINPGSKMPVINPNLQAVPKTGSQ